MDETDSQTNINGWREHWNERAKANEDIIWLNGYCVMEYL